jgi:hypothetical protein
LKTAPNRLRGFYGAARAAELAGQEATARLYRERLRTLTANATGQRAEIDYAREAIAGSR